MIDAMAHHQANRLAEAEAGYRRVLEMKPDHHVAYCLLGVIAANVNNMEEALSLFSQSIKINPDYADAHCHLGSLLAILGLYDEATRAFERALTLKPSYREAQMQKSKALQLSGRPADALAGFQQALTLDPQSADINFKIADLHRILGHSAKALAHFDTALAIDPTHTDAMSHKAVVLQSIGKPSEALQFFDKALALNENLPEVHNNKGSSLSLLERYDEALACFNRAMSLNSEAPATHSNRGVLFRITGRSPEAAESFRKAIKLAPDYAEAHQNLCFALLDTGEIEEALVENEWRWRMPNTAVPMRDYAKPLWDGKLDLSDKTILLWPEQGPQDVTIWATLIPEMVARSKRCIVQIYPKLVPLYKRSFPGAEIRPGANPYDKSQDDFDVHLPMGSLFKHFRPDLRSDAQEAFLVPDPDRVKFWRHRLEETGPGPYVGISWKGVVVTDIRSPNYTEVEDWSELIQKQATFFNLQCGQSADELDQFEKQHGIKVHDFDDLDLFDNLDEVAAFSAALDLAISVSTCVSAITAGVGTPTWVIAWRQSPWNNFLLKSRGPEVTYFERNTKESWEPAFKAMAEQLQIITDR